MFNFNFDLKKQKEKPQNIPAQGTIFSWASLKNACKAEVVETKKEKKVFGGEKKFSFGKAKIYFKDHWHLLIKSAAENHLRIQKCKTAPVEGEVCNLSFGSYTELKKYQKKLRLFTYSLSSTIASLLVAMMVIQLVFPSSSALGATFYFDQTGWNASASSAGTYLKHPPASSRDYESKDASVGILNPGSNSSIALTKVGGTDSKTETIDLQFANGVNNGAKVGVGGGSDGFVYTCQYDHGGANWEPTDGDTYDLAGAGTIEIAGTHCNIENFTIASGKTVYVKAWDGTNYGKTAIYAANSTITGTLSAKGKGYRGVIDANGEGPQGGKGRTVAGYNSGSGGGYGGNGGMEAGNNRPGGTTYGSASNPTDMGSAGGGVGGYAGVTGGGALKLNIVGTLNIDGQLDADAYHTSNYSAVGGGAGGSIFIAAETIAGTGLIHANSSYYSSTGGAGGGGRVAIHYNNNGFTVDSVKAKGGGSQIYGGGSGTVYWKSKTQTLGDLYLDSPGGGGGSANQSTPLPTDSVSAFNIISIKNKADLTNISGDISVTNLSLDSTARISSVGSINIGGSVNGQAGPNYILNSVNMVAGGSIGFPNANNLTLNSSNIQTAVLTVPGTLTVGSGTVISHMQGNLAGLTINAANVDVQNGGSVDVSGKGYVNRQGPSPGANTTYWASGGGYGGKGGTARYSVIGGQITYGSATSPNQLGSGGGCGNNGNCITAPGGSGGGIIRLNISGVLTVNGNINSNGVMGASELGGAGSGGSIWISAGNVAVGSGLIKADGGGPSGESGAGGGGRISIDGYSSFAFPNANISVAGGVGNYQTAESGTRYGNGSPLTTGEFSSKFAALPDLGNNIEKKESVENEQSLVKKILFFALGIETVKASSADFTSQAIDTGYDTTYSDITFSTITFSADAGIQFQIASNNDNATWNFVGPNNNTGAYYTSSGQAITGEHFNKRYIKYKAYFTYLADELHLNDVTLNYNFQRYPTNQSFVSSWYNTTDSANFLTGILWDENVSLPSGTAIKFQVQTAANNDNGTPQNLDDDIPGSATGFVGPDGSNTSYFTNINSCIKAMGAQAVACSVPNISIGDGVDDQWIKYKLVLDSTGAFTSQVDRIRMQYVVNYTPLISNMVASQNSNGIVNIGYDLRDDDSSSFSMYFMADVGVKVNDNPLSTSATTINLNGNYDNLPTGSQTIQINQEQITCASRSAGVLTSCQRGRNNSRLAVQARNSKVYFVANTANTTGTGSGISAGTGKSGTWTIKNDLPQIYVNNTTASIRVVANDGTLANQVSLEAGATASLDLDTKDPIFKITNPLLIDRISNKASSLNAKLTIKKPDTRDTVEDTAFDLYIKEIPKVDNCDLVTESDKYVGSPFAASTSFNPKKDFDISIPLIDLDPRKVCVRIKDSKGNITNREIVTPVPPANVKFYDFAQIAPNPSDSTFTELIVWDVYDNKNFDFAKYEVYRASKSEAWVDANPAGVPAQEDFVKLAHSDATIPNVNNNFFFDKFTDIADKSQILDTYFFYKIVVTDINGNISALSSPRVADIPNGQGGTDTKAPDVTISPITNKNVSWAQIDLHTDEIASAVVYYTDDASYKDFIKKDMEDYPGKFKNIADPSFVMDHKLFVAGLTKNTTYYAKAVVVDSSNNTAEKLTSFTTADGPQISNVTFDRNSNNEATIFWATDIDFPSAPGSTSRVEFSPTKSSDGTTLSSPPAFVEDIEPINKTKTHRITIRNLTQGVRYFFSVSSSYEDGRTAVDNNGGQFHSILTTVDDNAPEITNMEIPLVSFDAAAIQWMTNPQPTVGKVLYRKSTDTEFTETDESFTFDASHYVVIPALEAGKDYFFKIYARNINGDDILVDKFDKDFGIYKKGDYLKFTTPKDPSFDHPSLSKITFNDLNPSVLTDTDAVISFASDQPASCFVEYREDNIVEWKLALKYSEDPDVFGINHNIHIADLFPSQKHLYKVTCKDNLENVIVSPEKDFTTKEKLMTGGEWGTANGGDKVPPTISNVRVAAVSGESVTITWDTDEKGSSSVRYGTIGVDENIAGQGVVNKSSVGYVNAHTVLVNGLVPATKYVFVASSLDASGNISESAESSFTTSSPSSLSSIKAESKNLGEAVITWKTSQETTSTVEYGLTTSYGEKKESTTLTNEHSISLSNLNQGTTYHYRVKGKDKDGKLYASSDQTFEPKSPPQIDNISINDVSEHGAKVTFKTNVPTDAEVTYTDVQNNQTTGAQGVRELSTDHEIIIGDLAQGTTFAVIVSARDEQGTQSEIKGPDFTTGKDENPPKIDNVKTDSALTQTDKVQSIISWKTDEQATTSVLYREGRTGEEKEIKITDNLTNGHVAVITMFKPGTVYNFRVKSLDASGNIAISNDFALLTPKKRENIIQIIIGNFTDIFGWAKFN